MIVVGSSVRVRPSQKGWWFGRFYVGVEGEVTAITRILGVTTYHVRPEGRHFELPFRESELVELDERGMPRWP